MKTNRTTTPDHSIGCLSHEIANYWGLVKGETIMACRCVKRPGPLLLWAMKTPSRQWKESERGRALAVKEGTIQSTNHIATLEYYDIYSSALDEWRWKRLVELREFHLWDPIGGPIAFFKHKRSRYLALYRVYRIPLEIKSSDLGDQSHGNIVVPKEVAFRIKNEEESWEPILGNDIWNSRRRRILEVFDLATPENIQAAHKPIRISEVQKSAHKLSKHEDSPEEIIGSLRKMGIIKEGTSNTMLKLLNNPNQWWDDVRMTFLSIRTTIEEVVNKSVPQEIRQKPFRERLNYHVQHGKMTSILRNDLFALYKNTSETIHERVPKEEANKEYLQRVVIDLKWMLPQLKKLVFR